MARRTLASPHVRLLAAAAAVLVGLVLLFSPGPDSAAHDGHTEDLYRFTWNSGSTVTLDEYQFWHWNPYREQRCVAWEPLIQDCAAWQDTGATRERPQDSCAARPEWVVADVVNGAQATPAAPSGATCNRHDSYLEGNVQWVFTTAGHRTVADRGHAGRSPEQRCVPAGFGDPGSYPVDEHEVTPTGRRVGGVPEQFFDAAEPVRRVGAPVRVVVVGPTAPTGSRDDHVHCGGVPSRSRPLRGRKSRPRPQRGRKSRPRPRRGRGIGAGRVRMISRWVSRIRRRCRRTRMRG